MAQGNLPYRRLLGLCESFCQLVHREYEASTFAAEALTILSDAGCDREELLDELLTWIAEASELPRQNDLLGGFGEPPITLVQSGNAAIELLLWRTGRTAIHQHSFSGAFCVLDGSSLHCSYGFSSRYELDPRLLLGDVDLLQFEILTKGNARTILPGNKFIHGLFHLESPTITLVARRAEASTGTQFAYIRPHAAIGYVAPDSVARRCEAIRTLANDAARCERFVEDCCRSANAYSRFRYLHSGSPHVSPDFIHRLVDRYFSHLGSSVVEMVMRVFSFTSKEPSILAALANCADYKERISAARTLMAGDLLQAKQMEISDNSKSRPVG
jgi:hypothetical protein